MQGSGKPGPGNAISRSQFLRTVGIGAAGFAAAGAGLAGVARAHLPHDSVPSTGNPDPVHLKKPGYSPADGTAGAAENNDPEIWIYPTGSTALQSAFFSPSEPYGTASATQDAKNIQWVFGYNAQTHGHRAFFRLTIRGVPNIGDYFTLQASAGSTPIKFVFDTNLNGQTPTIRKIVKATYLPTLRNNITKAITDVASDLPVSAVNGVNSPATAWLYFDSPGEAGNDVSYASPIPDAILKFERSSQLDGTAPPNQQYRGYDPVPFPETGVSDGGSVKFAPGNYYLYGNASAPLIRLGKGAMLEALDPENRPVLNVRNDAVALFPAEAKGIRIDAPGHEASLKNLVYKGNRAIQVFGIDNLQISDCDIIVEPANAVQRDAGLSFRAEHPITGNVTIEYCTIIGTYRALEVNVGAFGTAANFTIKNCYIENSIAAGQTMRWGHAFAVDNNDNPANLHSGDFFIVGNKMLGPLTALFMGQSGNVIMVDNDLEADTYCRAYSGLSATALTVVGNTESSSLLINNNRIHMTMPDPVLLPIGVYQSAVPITSGLFMGDLPNRNTIFKNITIDGRSMDGSIDRDLGNSIGAYVWAWKNTNCSFMNISRPAPSSAYRWDLLGPKYPNVPAYPFTPLDYILESCSDCILIDNADPVAKVFDNNGAGNTLLGRLQQVYGVPGNPSGNIKYDMEKVSQCYFSGGIWDFGTMSCTCPAGTAFNPETGMCEAEE